MTLLRRVMARPCASVKQVVELGRDDFSFGRGRTFGTILVERPRHRVIDLLADRSVKTVSAWMRAHLQIRLVSRDRAGDSASAAAKAAPQARQCADRFHLQKNLREALEGVLARHLAAHRNSQAQKSRTTPLEDAPSQQPPKRSPKEAQHLHPEIDLAYDLVQQFARMLRTRTGAQLDDWLERVRASQIREFQGFVVGIERDKAAVVAGLTLPHNNGVVEGNVNKLKLLKRMMYGRARFPLLRQRVLHAL